MSHGGVRCFDEAMSADAISRTPALRPTVTTLGLSSSGPGDRPTIHRLVGLRPFSVSNIAQSPHGVGWPPLVGSHNLLCRRGLNQRSGIVHWRSYPGLPFTPFKRRPSGTTHLSAMPSACRLLQAARTCTAAMHRLGASGAREPSYCTCDAMH